MQARSHPTVECGVKEDAPSADEQHIEECNLTYQVVAVLSAVPDALDCEIDEIEVGHTIDDFGGVHCCVIILELIRPSCYLEAIAIHLLAPIQGGCNRAPEAIPSRRVWEGR